MSTPENLMRILFENFYRCNKHFVFNTNNFGCLSDDTLALFSCKFFPPAPPPPQKKKRNVLTSKMAAFLSSSKPRIRPLFCRLALIV